MNESSTGNRRCRVCGKAFEQLEKLAQHLKDAHAGANSPRAAAAAATRSSALATSTSASAVIGSRSGGSRADPPKPSAGLSLGDLFAAALQQPRGKEATGGSGGRRAVANRREEARVQWRRAAEAARQLTATRGVQGTLKVWVIVEKPY